MEGWVSFFLIMISIRVVMLLVLPRELRILLEAVFVQFFGLVLYNLEVDGIV